MTTSKPIRSDEKEPEMDLISVLVITYVLGGETHENEIQMAHGVCMDASAGITRAIGQDAGPTVELLDGTMVKVETATCVPGCFADAMSEDWELLPLMEAEGS